MAKVKPDQILLDASRLPTATSHLANFKQYVNSKYCYSSAPLNEAQILNIHNRIAYQCHMKILIDTRRVEWTEKAAQWIDENSESTKHGGEPIGDMWNDYKFDLPPLDNKSKDERTLPRSNYTSRCDNCCGKGQIDCNETDCRGIGRMPCNICKQTRLKYEGIQCSCNNGWITCAHCQGSGKQQCSVCSGQGGFYHSAILYVEWHTRATTWLYQNSFLPEKQILNGKPVLFWSSSQSPWSKESPIENFVQSINDETTDIQLKANLIRDYKEQHFNPKITSDNRMRRLQCSIKRFDFQEIHYTMGQKYVNKRYLERGNTFRFCQYPDAEGQQFIYEDDYPLNSCGCFGGKCACYSSWCTIL